MRLLHVYSGNLYGGIEAMLVQLARLQPVYPSLAHEFALCFDGVLRRNLESAGGIVHHLPAPRASRPWTVWRARRALAGLLASGRYDRVICHSAWPQVMFGPAVRRAGLPLVFWASETMTARHWTEKWARLTPPDLAICPSAFSQATLPALYPHAPSAVLYYPYQTPAPLSIEDRGRARAAFGASDAAVVVVQAGRLEPYKGYASTIEALSRLRDVPNWVFWVAGGAQRPFEQQYLDSLKASVERLGMSDRVRFLGHVSDMPRLLGSADIFCQPNLRAETWGLVFVEALGAGLLVVASQAGGVMEIVDESCGVLVPPGDITALAATLRALITDPVRRGALSAAAPGRARQLCDPRTQLATLHRLLLAMDGPADHAA